MFEMIDNALKSNRGWLNIVDRAQTEPDRLERQLRAREWLAGITAADLQALARSYLTDGGAVEIRVLPDGVDAP
jgi:zinc protease